MLQSLKHPMIGRIFNESEQHGSCHYWNSCANKRR